MSHNHHGSGKGSRKSSNPARARRRERSQDRLEAKKFRRVLRRNGEEAAAYWKIHGRLPEPQPFDRLKESAARMKEKHRASLEKLS